MKKLYRQHGNRELHSGRDVAERERLSPDTLSFTYQKAFTVRFALQSERDAFHEKRQGTESDRKKRVGNAFASGFCKLGFLEVESLGNSPDSFFRLLLHSFTISRLTFLFSTPVILHAV